MDPNLLSDDQFRKNIARWGQLCPGSEALLSQPCSRIEFHTQKNGMLNLKTERNGQTEFYHGSDPVAEAAEWFARQNLLHIKVLIVFGVGLGYYYDAALQWLRSNSGHYLVFLENDSEVLHRLLQTKRGAAMLFDDQVWLGYLEERSKPLHTVAIVFAPREYFFSALNYYQVTQSATLHWLQEHLGMLMNGRKQILAEYMGGKTFYSNFFRNFLLMPQAYLGNGLFGQFKDIPAIICGAGPSLARSLPLLAQLKDRALIFAGGTAMNAVNTTGLLPHFGVGVDPNEAQFTRLIMNQAFATPYFYRNRMLHEALNLVQGDHLYIAGSPFPLLHWLEAQLGIRGEELEGGHNVINLSLAIACAMGCNPIIFVGVDLAYTDGLSYCPGLVNHPLHEMKKYFQTKSKADELITRQDVNGKPVSTQIKWVAESLWFTQFANKHPEVVLINSSDGGIGFEGIPNIPLSQVAEAWLQKSFPFEALIHDKIQNASMPLQVNSGRIHSLLSELLQSLERCHTACLTARTEFQNVAKGLAGDRKAALPESDAQTRLLSEPAYKQMLEFYKDIFLELHILTLRRLANPKHNFTEAEVALQKSLIYEACYEVILKIAKDNIDLLKAILEQHKPDIDAPPMHRTLNQPTSESEYDSNGSLKILRKFYLTGLQYGVERYSSGKLDGIQEYFYPSQTPKTILPYANGRLEGQVQLYHSNGKIKRELAFQQGHRHGKERIWNEAGQLIIEAEFAHDLPTGIARQWDDNGQLLKEVVYTSETEYTVRAWRPDGTLITDSEDATSDYFDKAFLLLSQLLLQLEQALQQTRALAPLIEKVNAQSTAALLEVQNEIEQDLTQVREIHANLRQEAASIESIWKTPSNQRRLERQLAELSTKVNHQLKRLQDILSKAMQILLKKGP